MTGEYQDYRDGDTVCEAYVARAAGVDRAPAVLVAHQWAGQSEHERATADWAADLGYVGIAIDVYGKGRRGSQGEDAMQVNGALMQPFLDDRAMLRRRLLAAVDFAAGLDGVEAARIGVIGFCFGGLCALDIARSGTDRVRGVVSVHGLFTPPGLGEQPPIKASVLVCHGWDDPMAPPDAAVALGRELTQAGAEWQLIAFGHAMHAFTAKGANMPERGLKYDARADRVTWEAAQAFFAEQLA